MRVRSIVGKMKQGIGCRESGPSGKIDLVIPCNLCTSSLYLTMGDSLVHGRMNSQTASRSFYVFHNPA